MERSAEQVQGNTARRRVDRPRRPVGARFGAAARERLAAPARTRLVAAALAFSALLALPVAAAGATGEGDATSTRPHRRRVAHAPGTPCPGAGLRPTPTDVKTVERATMCLIDQARATGALGGLRPNGDLQRVAAGQSQEMVLGDYFGDDTRSGRTPLERIVASPYPHHASTVSAAQNIGWGTGREASPAEMVASWMRSPPHRAIILTGEFRDIGVGVAPAAPASLAGGHRGATYTVDFGARRH